ncbi:putative L-ascorbate peroxidase 6 [Telopea speciosissima]|uniref:putative L-ascorbate peroxidase 6 n=1 Tax=Telopea speciosissima TaxID=54955 RepID=UPI001CC5E29A|nr:putative L-ascorbate peroxidase 6 [Telopea speciosissima]
MTTNVLNPSLLFSVGNVSSSPDFKFPATSRGRSSVPFKSGSKLFKASSSFTTHNDEDSRGNDFGALHRREGLIFMVALPVLLPLGGLTHGLNVNAADESLIIREGVRKVVSKGKAAGVLRLAFHDAGTFDMDDISGGMNGSIVYELDRPENSGLKKSVKILEKAKSEVGIIQPVSWADMIAVGGAEAISICGGPIIPVQSGRLDSMVPDPEGKLPQESLDASGLKQCFLRKGFSTQELVALSGAHTLGSKGFGNPTVFDNSYFKILLEKPWLSSAGMSSMIGLPTDHALAEDNECLRWITEYAESQNRFFDDFRDAYIKLVNSGARWKYV